jgi:hypothetical protein
MTSDPDENSGSAKGSTVQNNDDSLLEYHTRKRRSLVSPLSMGLRAWGWTLLASAMAVVIVAVVFAAVSSVQVGNDVGLLASGLLLVTLFGWIAAAPVAVVAGALTACAVGCSVRGTTTPPDAIRRSRQATLAACAVTVIATALVPLLTRGTPPDVFSIFPFSVEVLVTAFLAWRVPRTARSLALRAGSDVPVHAEDR